MSAFDFGRRKQPVLVIDRMRILESPTPLSSKARSTVRRTERCTRATVKSPAVAGKSYPQFKKIT
ncbi:MAG: hypothetical protein PVG15_18665 [Desulfobacterales bacterium]